jgi:hypothetical protein
MTKTELDWSMIKFMTGWLVVGLIGWYLSDKIKGVYYKITSF